MKAKSLKPGDTIGVFSSSSWVSAEDLERAKAHAEGMGFKVFIHPQATARNNQSAGDAREKAAAFNELVVDPSISAIIGSRGGNRALMMLDHIDFEALRRHPKIVMGYSDVTALLNGIYKETGLVTFHGPLFREWPQRPESAKIPAILGGETVALDSAGAKSLCDGIAEGPLIGGNLSILQALSGTHWQPDTDNAILFIEDIGDHISRYDRMLIHMRLAGWFNRISGFIIGRFAETGDDAERPFGFSLEDVVREHLDGLDIPVVMDVPFGHGGSLPVYPVGGRARLEARGHNVSLKLSEPAVTR